MSDKELERLKRRRMLKLQRKVLMESSKEEDTKNEVDVDLTKPTNQEILSSVFRGRSMEVYKTALRQFPNMVPNVEEFLVEAIRTGKIKGEINGAELYQFFNRIGIPVRLKTRIRFAEKGELKSLEEKIKSDIS